MFFKRKSNLFFRAFSNFCRLHSYCRVKLLVVCKLQEYRKYIFNQIQLFS
ncbi:hypothetical protein Mgra_00003446 [Meloidogyne graminicola]|uniref:Uncharacterized protein n=1 Tax=Meloidogyne graminicola TaxID=189291 RepID=A0A8S9ZV58_9BILA|nr:hypothetical protein Mgra_00003446 [Meloidogyne graminicola]